MELGWKVWLKNDENKIFGTGPKILLLKIEECGSLRKAATSMNMSYSKAWNIISNLEKSLGFKILHKYVGGVGGGGSTLTYEARELIKKYDEFEREVEENIKKIYKKYF
jgi:molybdate transport repressor ModE-like protein